MRNILPFKIPSFFYFLSFFVAAVFVFLGHSQSINSLSTNQLFSEKAQIIEYLKISVPSLYRDAWINTEKETWEPWLKQKEGFVGRQMYLNEQSEEAILLIGWETRKKWKSISQKDIDNVQRIFEKVARTRVGIEEGNPFPLIDEGELIPQ